MLKTNNVDHHRTADYPALAAALHGKPGKTAAMREVLTAPAILLIGNDPTNQHPLLAWQIRTNVRLRRAQALCNQLGADQAAAAGGRIRADSGRCGSESSRIPCRRRFRCLDALVERRHDPRCVDCAARENSRRTESGHCVWIRAARQRYYETCEFCLDLDRREADLPWRLLEFARRQRNGTLSRPVCPDTNRSRALQISTGLGRASD